jgi:hypothetical protein
MQRSITIRYGAMPGFEELVAAALSKALDDSVGQIEKGFERGKPWHEADRLAPGVAAAIDAVIEQYVDLLAEHGAAVLLGDEQVYDTVTARRKLEAIAIDALLSEG